MSKIAKHRFCPAVQRQISPAECGENRGSRYACPSDCNFSPLASANYTLLLEMENELDRKSGINMEAEELASPALRKARQQAAAAPSPHAWHVFCELTLYFQKDAAWLTLAERWRRKGLPGLKNDERVLFEAKMRTRVALLEIHRILDDQQIEAVDLLDAEPRPILLRDRSLSATVARFSNALVWIYPLPHYWRLSGTAIILPEIAQLEPAEIVLETARHLGAPSAEMELRLWLADNFIRMDESFRATSRMRRLQMFTDLDAQYGKAVYELRAPFGVCRDALDKIAEVDLDSLSPVERDEGFAEARVWMAQPDQAKVGDPGFTLGRVLLGQSHCRLESMGRERLIRLREQFESVLGERARFTSERFDNLAAKYAEKDPAPNLAIIPPRLLEDPVKLVLGASRIQIPPGVSKEELETQQRARQYRDFLETPVPVLNDQTPRAATQDPVLRPKLIRLLKQWVRKHDEDNLRSGRHEDINWMLRELGATEIIFDSPPPRRKLEDPNKMDGEEFEDSADASDLPCPFLPPEPLSPSEIAARQEVIFREFSGPENAVDYLRECGSIFIDDANALCGEDLPPEEFDLFIPFLIQARFTLVPRGFREPVLDFDRLTRAFAQSLEELAPNSKSPPPDIGVWFEASLQPVLVQMLALEMAQAFESLPKKMKKPSPFAQLMMIIVLRNLIDELHQSIREQLNIWPS